MSPLRTPMRAAATVAGRTTRSGDGAPPGETLHMHELSGLWPYDTALGGMLAFVAFVGLPLAPFLASVVVTWSGFLHLGRHRPPRPVLRPDTCAQHAPVRLRAC